MNEVVYDVETFLCKRCGAVYKRLGGQQGPNGFLVSRSGKPRPPCRSPDDCIRHTRRVHGATIPMGVMVVWEER